ncbi:MAG: PIN domain nuclease [bacterium]|nr:PIN domain nuclease [bacterium]
MIAVDTSSLIAFLGGEEGDDVKALEQALEFEQAALPPVVVTEILSVPRLDRRIGALVRAMPSLEIRAGFWERAAATRRKLLGKRLRARLADTLIAQVCVDSGTPLITRDSDFRHFERHAGLRLV